MTEKHDIYMKRAIGLARRGRKGAAPNPAVGAVLVKGDKIIAAGCHARFGGPHAERVALKKAGAKARGATLYVTLEPCCHFGKTPPCTEAIIEAGVRKVVIAHRDPIDFVSGKGIAKLKRAGIGIVEGVLREESALMNLPYLKRARTGTPYVILKWAMTLDGKIASHTGDSRGISSEKALGFGHSLRGEVDAILVGLRTVIADDPRLTCRRAQGKNPARIVLDTKCALAPDSKLARTAGRIPLIIATTKMAPTLRRRALSALGAEVIVVGKGSGGIDIKALLTELAERKISSLLVEGGGKVHASFIASGLADEVCALVAPKILGGDKAATPVRGGGIARIADAARLHDLTVKRLGTDTLIRGRLRSLAWYLGR